MTNSSDTSEKPEPATVNQRDLEATVTWLRGLSTAEMEQLREAMSTHDAESLALFAIRFATCLDLTVRT